MEGILLVDGEENAIFCHDASRIGQNIATIKKGLESGWKPTSEVAELLISDGDQVDCIKTMHQAGCPITDEMVKMAAMHGRINCLQYFVSVGYQMNESIAILAAMTGQLDCLEYLTEIGACPENICGLAAATNQLECLEWLYNKGFKLYDTAASAATYGSVECLIFALNACGGEVEIDIEKMIMNGHLECTKIIHEIGGLSDSDADLAIIYDQMEIFEYLKSEGYKWSKHLIDSDGNRSWIAMKLTKEYTATRRAKERELKGSIHNNSLSCE